MRLKTLLIPAFFALAFAGCKSDDGGTQEIPEEETDDDNEDDDSDDDSAEVSTGTPDPTTGTVEDTTTGGDDEGESSSSTGPGIVQCGYDDPGWQYYGPGVEIPHWELVDHNGEVFRVCDYWDHPLVLDTSAAWCPPCQALADYMAGNDAAASGIINDPVWVENYLSVIRDYVNWGCVKWFTVITENPSGGPAQDIDAANWDASYHNPEIPVIADPTGEFAQYMMITQYPTTFLINNDFKYITNDLISGLMLIVDNLECEPPGDGG